MDQNNMNGMNFVMGGDSSEAEKPVNNVGPVPAPVDGGMLGPVLNQSSQAPMPEPMVQPQNVQTPIMPNGAMGSVNQTPPPVNNMMQPQGMPNNTMPTGMMGNANPVPPVNNGITPPKNIVEAATTVPNPTPGNNQPVTPLINSAPPVEPVPENTNTQVENTGKNEKTKKIIIAVGVVVVSIAIGVLIGYLLFNKLGNKNNANDEDYSETIYYGE